VACASAAFAPTSEPMVMIIKAAEGSFIVVFLISFQKAQP
jgi:hypothetical protein